MGRVQGYVVFVIVVCCASVVLPWSGAAGASRPDGQAIQFRVGSSFTLSDFDGATLAYQRFLGRDVAWRLSLEVDLRFDSGEISQKRAGQFNIDESFDIWEKGHAISLSSEWLAYRGDGVSVFFGGGPRFSYDSRQDEDWDFSWGTWRFVGSREESYGVGLQGCLGIQWAATDWLALHAEYSVRCTYSHHVREYQYVLTETDDGFDAEVETETIDRFLLDSRGVRFGLSAYF